MIYSHSRLKKFEQCPWSFFLVYVKGQKEKDNEMMVTGKVVHKALELIAKDSTLSTDEAMFKAVMEEGTVVIDWKFAKTMTNIGRKHIDTFGTAIKAELHFQLPLDPNDSFSSEVQGYIDIVNEQFLSIIDWKTGFKEYKPLEAKQLGLYAWAVSQIYGVDTVEAGYYFLRYNKWKDYRHTYTKVDMEKAKQWAVNLANKIEQKLVKVDIEGMASEEVFKKTPGEACQYCPSAGDCQMDEIEKDKAQGIDTLDPEQINVPETYEKAQELGGLVLRLDAASKKIKDCMKAFVEQTGEGIIVDEKCWDFYPTTSWNFEAESKKNLAVMLANRGENPWDMLNFGARDLTKIKKILGIIEDDELRKLGGIPKSRSSFKAMSAQNITVKKKRLEKKESEEEKMTA